MLCGRSVIISHFIDHPLQAEDFIQAPSSNWNKHLYKGFLRNFLPPFHGVQEPFRFCLALRVTIDIQKNAHFADYEVGKNVLKALQYHKNDAINHACADTINDHRPRNGEHLGPYSVHPIFWLCQDRHTVFSEFFQLPPKWGPLIVLACRYECKPARSTHIYLNLS